MLKYQRINLKGYTRHITGQLETHDLNYQKLLIDLAMCFVCYTLVKRPWHHNGSIFSDSVVTAIQSIFTPCLRHQLNFQLKFLNFTVNHSQAELSCFVDGINDNILLLVVT